MEKMAIEKLQEQMDFTKELLDMLREAAREGWDMPYSYIQRCRQINSTLGISNDEDNILF